MGRRGWKLTAALVVLGSLAGRGLDAADDGAAAADDGWRRTAAGWVHIDQMRAEAQGIPPRQPDRFISDEQNRPRQSRWDFHPAVLAVGQILVAAAAFAGVRAQVRSLRNSGIKSSLDSSHPCRKAA